MGPQYHYAGFLKRTITCFILAIFLFIWPIDGKPASSGDDLHLGAELMAQGRFEEAVAVFDRAVVAAPGHPAAYRQRAAARRQVGDLAGAVKDLSRVLELAPDDVAALYQRATALFHLEDDQRCLADCNRLVALTPEDPSAYLLRATVYQGQGGGHWDAALSDLQAAFDLSPDDPVLLNQLAWFFATCPKDELRDGLRALALARRASELSREMAIFDSLAAAYAELGQFAIARIIQKRVIEMSRASGTQAEEAVYAKRLALYERHQVWRQPSYHKLQAVEENASGSPPGASALVAQTPTGSVAPAPVAPAKRSSPAGQESVSHSAAAPDASSSAAGSAFGRTVPAPPPYSVQIASFNSPEKAIGIVDDLKKSADPAFCAPAQIPGRGTWYRIYLGRYLSYSEAEEALCHIRKGRFKDAILVHRPWSLVQVEGSPAFPERFPWIGLSTYPDGCIGAFETQKDANWVARALGEKGFKVKVVDPRGR